MTATTLPLADGFAAATDADWERMALAALKGASIEKLTTQTYDRVDVRPLYTRADLPGDTGLPGVAPFVAGGAPVSDAFLPWDIRQTVLHPDPVAAGREALVDLEHGVSSIELVLDPTGACGIAVRDSADFRAATKGLMLDLATVALNASAAGLEAAAALAGAVDASARASAKLAFNIDPLGAVMASGSASASLSEVIRFASWAGDVFPAASALRADARPVHEAGGSEAQELAALIASGVAWLRAGDAAGMSVGTVNATLLFTLSVGPDVVVEIAKLRAARRLWARVLAACGASGPMRLQAVSSARMMTRRDPWTNMLRTTSACFAAGVGGADVVTILPFTAALGLPTGFARRIARNTQIILQEESHLGRVADPAGGSFAIEKLAHDLDEAAWGLFQQIEAEGGLAESLAAGALQARVASVKNERLKNISRRKDAIVGVGEFANLGEAPVEVLVADVAAVLARPARPSVRPASRGIGDLVAAAEAGASLTDLADGTGPNADALPPMRLAAGFEVLRDRADALGDRAVIFLATLGSLAEFNARSTFTKNAFEAGGLAALAAETVHSDDAALAAAFKASGSSLACVCGTDAAYAERGASAAAALKAAGATGVWLAGRPGDLEPALRAGGVDRFVFAGADILSELNHAHGLLAAQGDAA